MRSLMTLTVNGEAREVAVPVHKTLLEVLREDLALTGTKHGCELGECGTCTVLVDGEPVLSCLALPVECQGRDDPTVEGMAEGGRLHPLQQAFAELGAAQCGYCTPGILLTAEALLDAHAAARRATRSGHALAGNLCRCTGYTKILDAVELAAGRTAWPGAGSRAMSTRTSDRFSVIGQPLPKIDAWAKVTGETRFADDIVLPRMAYAQAAAQPAPARPASGASTRRARRGAARRLRGHHRARPAARQVRHPAGVARTRRRSASRRCAWWATRWPRWPPWTRRRPSAPRG